MKILERHEIHHIIQLLQKELNELKFGEHANTEIVLGRMEKIEKLIIKLLNLYANKQARFQ